MHSQRILSFCVFAACVGVIVALPNAASGQDAKPVRQVRWSQLKAEGELTAGDVVEQPDAIPSEQLVVEVAKDNPQPVHLCTLEDPGVGAPAYALRGSVKCDGISSPGYLEMWNFFPDGSAYFTRTLGSFGPMAALQGTSDWRAMELPFTINLPDAAARQKMRPNRLVVNLVLPTGGKVSLSNLELAQYDESAIAPPFASGAWWSGRTGGVVGAVLGSLVGLLGAVIGVSASRGRSARLVQWLLFGCAALGVLLLLVGAVAMLMGQPWHVSGPFMVTGVPATFVPLLLLPSVNRNLQARELRRIQALDAGA